MKVFLSWSGEKSHKVALAMQDWIPYVIQSVSPYVSSEDIDKGKRWSTDIAKELEDSSFGILCITRDNVEAPWLMFEAGALSKITDTSHVCPFLFDLKMAEIKDSPILQFQTTNYDKEDIKKLIASLNKCCGDAGVKQELLAKTFDQWWPNLEKSLDAIKKETSKDESPKEKKDTKDILEEILELSRVNQKLLRSPETLFPTAYFEQILKNNIDNNLFPKGGKEIELIRAEAFSIRIFLDKIHELIWTYKRNDKAIDKEFEDVFLNNLSTIEKKLGKIYSVSNGVFIS